MKKRGWLFVVSQRPAASRSPSYVKFAEIGERRGLVGPRAPSQPHFAAGAGVGFHAAARRFAFAICPGVIFLAMPSRSFVAA
jgi:hypothetical protein